MGTMGSKWQKWRIVAWYWLAQTALLCVLPALWVAHWGTIDRRSGNAIGGIRWEAIEESATDWEYWLFVGIVSAGMIALQAIMLLPVRKPRARRERGWPLWLSAGVSGIGAVALLGGIFLMGVAVVRLFELELHLALDPSDNTARQLALVAVWGTLLLSWALSTFLIASFMKRRLDTGDGHEGVLRRVAKLLLKGTAVEALAVIPLDVMVRRKTECYSAEGTCWTITLCMSVGLLALGPAIIAPLIARRRKDFYAGRCELCLYDMRELIASGRSIDRCPECGGGWKARSNTGDGA